MMPDPEERTGGSPLVPGVLLAAGSLALLVAAFVYSLASVLPDRQDAPSAVRAAETRSPSSVVAGSTSRSVEFVAGGAEHLVLVLCNGEVVTAAVGEGPVYHQYVVELMAETRVAFPQVARFSASNCVRASGVISEFR